MKLFNLIALSYNVEITPIENDHLQFEIVMGLHQFRIITMDNDGHYPNGFILLKWVDVTIQRKGEWIVPVHESWMRKEIVKFCRRLVIAARRQTHPRWNPNIQV